MNFVPFNAIHMAKYDFSVEKFGKPGQFLFGHVGNPSILPDFFEELSIFGGELILTTQRRYSKIRYLGTNRCLKPAGSGQHNGSIGQTQQITKISTGHFDESIYGTRIT